MNSTTKDSDSASADLRRPFSVMARHRSAVQPELSWRPIRVTRSAAVALSPGTAITADAQVFLQERIGLWTFWVFALSFGFYLTNVISWPFVRGLSWREFIGVFVGAGQPAPRYRVTVLRRHVGPCHTPRRCRCRCSA